MEYRKLLFKQWRMFLLWLIVLVVSAPFACMYLHEFYQLMKEMQ